jgi:transposase-like protein
MRQRRKFSLKTKIAAVEAYKSGTPYRQVLARYKIVSSVLWGWIKQYDAGELGTAKRGRAPKAKGSDAPQTLERVFDDRVREAISWLRRAEKEVERMKRTGAIKEPDKAHLCAMMALRDLQGDNGT